ncbi:cytochrome P450 [Mycobacterium shimoidei]|uniref:cytochrome P450 n=1 Tax=Mycobacterium shimoidei TaxID=29313 RepID=UPI0008489AB9|nr:cytochrome P450 [Mycobacterium shimoidei]MCV7257157.1 cytochrome P450 [Mycobacterium shimoidei]ODR14492.1 cytochrome P450 [Mycobacterium shimoidei]ORW80570.1 cytochrome P450 [Mycobacterium shimoidei]
MIDPATADPCEVLTPHGLNPPRIRLPKLVQGAAFAFFRRRSMRHWINRYGHIFEMNVPFFGRSVIVSDPALVRLMCTTGAEDLVNVQPNIGNLLGPGSVFALDDQPHRDRRRLLSPPLHGQCLKGYEQMIVEEALREAANWPENKEFRILEPMNRIALNVILRTLFGAEEPEFGELREILPSFMKLGSVMAFVPRPPFRTGRLGPWGKLDRSRRAIDRIIFTLIDRAEADPNLADRRDILALLLRSRNDDGTAIPPMDICDELLTLIAAGHESSTGALSWLFERLRRHPDVVAELIRELEEGGSEFRRATISESLRARTVLDVVGRKVRSSDFNLGGWRIPQGRTVLVRIADIHDDPQIFPHPERFDPTRFLGSRPAPQTWLPFGVGSRRCVGAEFVSAEMDIVLRTVLENFRIQTDAAPDEKVHFRGVTHTPKLGGLIVVNRRR